MYAFVVESHMYIVAGTVRITSSRENFALKETPCEEASGPPNRENVQIFAFVSNLLLNRNLSEKGLHAKIELAWKQKMWKCFHMQALYGCSINIYATEVF